MNEGKRIGIEDVAEAAGVSITTVSHALSGKGRPPDATRERVARIARELGYRPHPTAPSLSMGPRGSSPRWSPRPEVRRSRSRRSTTTLR